MIEQPFNVASKQSEKQKIELAEEQRIEKVARIKDPVQRRKAYTMLNSREHLLDQLKAQKEQKVDNAVFEEIRKKAQPKAELHIKPPMGAGSHTPKQREEFIRTQIKNSLGKTLDEGIRTVEKTENAKIDEFVKNTLDKERTKSKTVSKADKFKTNAEEITKAKGKTRFEELSPLNPNAEKKYYDEISGNAKIQKPDMSMEEWNKSVDEQLRGLRPGDQKYASLMAEKNWIEGERGTQETPENRKTMSGDASTRKEEASINADDITNAKVRPVERRTSTRRSKDRSGHNRGRTR